MKKVAITILILVVLAGGGWWLFQDRIISLVFSPTSSQIPTGVSSINKMNQFKENAQSEDEEPIQVVATDLEIPWEIAFLSDDSLLVTERPGRLTRIFPDRKESLEISGVVHTGESGLQGMALHPNFEQNRQIYLYSTTRDGDGLSNRIERYVLNLENNSLSNREVILGNIPGAIYHDGGRIEFGPDGMLYVGTGDATQAELAQDLNSLAGKILRLTDEGEVPANNPFNSLVYSYGHRNVQGLAWDNENNLWASEHGPSGSETGNDEINLIQAGKNYGWPEIRGQETQTGMESPAIESGRQDTWAPADVEIVGSRLFFAGLRGEALYQANINNQKLTNLLANFKEEYGRLRIVRVGPDGWLYIGTSNQDGRGQTKTNDDQIIKINLSQVFE